MADKAELSKSEWLVMNRVWELEKTTAREVAEALRERTDWSYNTVKTMLSRLAEKGWVTETKVGGTCFYYPAAKRKGAIKHLLDDVLDRVLDGSLEPLVSYLGGNRNLTEEQLEALERLVKKNEGEKK